MSKLTTKLMKRRFVLIPALLTLAALVAQPATAKQPTLNPPCPICGGAWDDYVELVTSVTEFNIEFAFSILDY